MINLKVFLNGLQSLKGSRSPAIPLAACFIALGALLKDASFNKAPRAMKQAARGIAGLLEPFRDCNPLRNTFKLIIHQGIIFLRLDFLKDHHLCLR